MSARQRFVAQPRTSGNGDNELEITGDAESQAQIASSERIQPAPTGGSGDAVARPSHRPEPGQPLGITTQPLNISSLRRPRKGDSTPNPGGKRPRNSAIEKIKNSENTSLSRSPKPAVMSPHIPRATASSSSFAFSVPTVQESNHTSGFQLAASPFKLNRTEPTDPTHSPRHVRTPRHRSASAAAQSFQAFQSTNQASALAPPAIDSGMGDPHAQGLSSERVYDFEVPTDSPGTARLQSLSGVLEHLEQGPPLNRPLRRVAKRIGNNNDETEALDEDHVRKRIRQDSHPITEGLSSPAETNEYQGYQQLGKDTTPRPDGVPLQYVSPIGVQCQTRDEPAFRLFGLDIDAYLSEHVEQYETAKKKWGTCSNDEWKAGATEMSNKFNKIMDFVKGHMETKWKLYASLNDKVSQHKTVLSERDGVLKGLRDRLVRDSGNVLGGQGSSKGMDEGSIAKK